MGYHTQHVRVGFDTAASYSVNLLKGGNRLPDNIVVKYEFSATMDDEDLNITGYVIGGSAINTALVTTEIAGSANLVGHVDLSTAAKGFWKLVFTLDTTITGEYVDIFVTTW